MTEQPNHLVCKQCGCKLAAQRKHIFFCDDRCETRYDFHRKVEAEKAALKKAREQ